MGVSVVFAVIICPGRLLAEQSEAVYLQSFEGRTPLFSQGASDAVGQVLQHDLTTDGPHDGRQCERIRTRHQTGTFHYFVMPIGKVDVVSGLTLSLWVRARRPGVRLAARVVLPHSIDPVTGRARTVLVPGDTYAHVPSWQRLTVGGVADLLPTLKTSGKIAATQPTSLRGAYVDAMVVNCYVGSGENEVFLDQLEVRPIVVPGRTRRARPAVDETAPRSVSFRGDRLLIQGKPSYLFGVEWTDADLRAVRAYRFNSVLMPAEAPLKRLRDASQLGFWMQVKLPAPRSPRAIEQAVTHVLQAVRDNDTVVSWHAGGPLADADREWVEKAREAIHRVDYRSRRALTFECERLGLELESAAQLVGSYWNPFAGSLSFRSMAQWWRMWRQYHRPGKFVWARLAVHMPEAQARMAYGRSADAASDQPIGPDGDQVELLVHAAVSSGFRALVFDSDRHLRAERRGLDRLAALALAALRMEVVGPIIAGSSHPEFLEGAAVPDIKQSIKPRLRRLYRVDFRYRHSGRPTWASRFCYGPHVLLLPATHVPGDQYVPGEGVQFGASVVVPGVSDAAQAWLLDFGRVQNLERERCIGGTRVTIPELDLTGVVLITPDLEELHRLRRMVEDRTPLAAQLAIECLKRKVQKVEPVHNELVALGKSSRAKESLLQQSRQALRRSMEWFDGKQFALAYRRARLGMRPLRVLQREYWEEALKPWRLPQASPYTLDFYGLAQHYRLLERVRNSQFTANLVANPGFELGQVDRPEGWSAHRHGPPGVKIGLFRTARHVHSGTQGIGLKVWWPGPGNRPALADRLTAELLSRPVAVQPGDVYRVTAYVLARDLPDTSRGAVVSCTYGGRQYEARQVESSGGWQKIVLYREVRDPQVKSIQVRLGLCAYGTAYFDDISVEKIAAAKPQ